MLEVYGCFYLVRVVFFFFFLIEYVMWILDVVGKIKEKKDIRILIFIFFLDLIDCDSFKCKFLNCFNIC